MKSWLKSLTLLTVAVVTTVNPLIPRKVAAQTVQPTESIRIYVPPPENSVSPGICPSFLEPTLDAIVERPAFNRGTWGILVESLNEGTVLYSHNSEKALIPASNIKLLTTAAALQLYDPQSAIRSSSLEEWIRVTNLRSNNNYADVLLSHVGGSQRAQELLSQLGVDPREIRQVDGSGLSRSNSATPRALVSLLRGMSYANNGEVFYASLPVAGISGTLRNRLHNPTVQGRVHAKTGTLRGVRALSGYIDHPDYGILVFSIMVNQPNQSGQVLVSAIDEIVLRLTQLSPC